MEYSNKINYYGIRQGRFTIKDKVYLYWPYTNDGSLSLKFEVQEVVLVILIVSAIPIFL